MDEWVQCNVKSGKNPGNPVNQRKLHTVHTLIFGKPTKVAHGRTRVNSKIDTANKILGIIRGSFMYLSAEIVIPLYKAIVRSHFDYAMIIWNSHAVKYIESREGVQRRDTKMVPEIKKTYHILKDLST